MASSLLFVLFFLILISPVRSLSIPTAGFKEYISFKSINEYISHLATISTLPKGFSVGSSRFTFTPTEVDASLPMNLTIIKLDQPTESFAAMFTSNQFPGGPIIVGKDRMANSKVLQAVVINNKISNVCPGSGISDRGVGDSDEICRSVAEYLQLESKNVVIPSSTGIIGWRLPVSAIKEAIPHTISSLQSESALPAAMGITTTDRYPKVRSYVSKGNTPWSIVGIAKGAGMIEPNMATMLCYIMTDLAIDRQCLQKRLEIATSKSFNTISVDGDQSTSDTVLAMSSNVYDCYEEKEFQDALNEVCIGLAEDIVRNGEGTQHVIKVTVTGAPSDLFARDLGRFVSNSNLVKCAINGCDPNVGRIVGAIGSFLGKFENGMEYTKGLSVEINKQKIFADGAFSLNPQIENILSDSMFKAQLYPDNIPEIDRNYPTHDLTVDIDISLNYDTANTGVCTVIGSDLTKDYVEVNADYRS